MFRHNFAVGVMYAALLYVCCKYKDLECKLALKEMECECYKSIAQFTSNTNEKSDKKKD
jgi:hypothetical protein